MENITDVRNYKVTGKFDITSSFKSDGESTESKHVTLRFVLDNVPLIDILTPALANKKITWVNGPGRSKFNKWADRSVIEVDYTSPAKKVKTREEYIEEYASAFMKAGLPEEKAFELATKAVDNPEVIEKKRDEVVE